MAVYELKLTQNFASRVFDILYKVVLVVHVPTFLKRLGSQLKSSVNIILWFSFAHIVNKTTTK